MTNYDIRIAVQEGELKNIFDELNNAQEVIYDCYNRLRSLGMITITEKPSVAADGSPRKN